MTVEFEKQDSKGKDAESRVASILLRAGFQTQMRSRGPRYDIFVWCASGPELIEVKNEDKYENGKNACIELGQQGRRSGLLRTESTICVHTFGKMCLVYRTHMLREWLREAIHSGVFEVRDIGGDNLNRGCLVPRESIAAHPWAELLPLALLPDSKLLLAKWGEAYA